MIENDLIQPLMESLDLGRVMSSQAIESQFPLERCIAESNVTRVASGGSRRRLWTLGPSGVAIAAVALTASVLGGFLLAETDVAANSSSPSYALPAAQVRGRLEVALGRDFPQQYAGTAFVDHGSRLEVYVTSLPIGLQSRVGYFVPLSMVDFRVVKHSLADLNAVADQIASDFPKLEAEGIEVASIQSDFTSNSVIVDVVNATQTDVNTLNEYYGASDLTIQSVPASAIAGTSGALITKEPTSGG
jgi:hypothetical protein